MAATIGVTTGLTESFTPDAGHISDVSSDTSIETVKIKNESGVTVRLLPTKMVTNSVTISGQGTIALATHAVAGDFTVSTAKVTSAKQSENNEGTPEFEATLVVYSNLA